MKIKLYLPVLLLQLLASHAFSQPDLQLSNSQVLSGSLGKGGHFRLSLSIKNMGNQAATNSTATIYLSTTTTLTAVAIPVSNIAIPALGAGQHTPAIQFVHPLPYHVPAGINYLIVRLDAENQVAETDEANDFYNTHPITVSNGIEQKQNLPYPIIFIHGLNSQNSTWNDALRDLQQNLGWSFGGNMNFCLNQDGSLSTSNKATDYKDWTDRGALWPGDMYTTNFSVSTAGVSIPSPNDLLSNQAAITKQGLAVRDAIAHVLAVTGRKKVILVGHSMGGLASREYLQNSNLWQPDGEHHVAKLLTVGTPHGGSNSTTFGISVQGLNERSEAVRDLRTSYLNGRPGVYLFGGVENTSTISNFLTPYYNIDVDCNGATGNTVIGLNQKAIPQNLAYSCIIGTGSSIGGGDGVVDAPKANLKNYYPALAVDTFITIAEEIIWHTQLPKLTQLLVKGMDEPAADTLAYHIETGQLQFGNITVQSKGQAIFADRDSYAFTLAESQWVNLKLYGLPLANCTIQILDGEGQAVYSGNNNGNSYYDLSLPLQAGKFNLSVAATVQNTTQYYTYALQVSLAGNGICPGSTTVFQAGIAGNSYQWQVDRGNGFENITDNDDYQGTQTGSLTLLAPSTSWRGYRYQCVADGNVAGDITTLFFAVRWTGAADSAWENPANWNCGILPDANTDVLVNAGVPHMPVVSQAAACHSLRLLPAAQVTVKPAAVLDIEGKSE